MFVHHLVQEMPGVFRAVAPVMGTPLLGYLVGSQYQLVAQQELARKTSVIELHDRSDKDVPPLGANSSAGWLYEPLVRAVGVWAAIHQCSKEPAQAKGPYMGGSTHLECWEFPSCASGGQVMYCLC